ncbi:MAG: ribosome maturation factor RimP [Candidatus Nanopelagicaceae bacterium]
MPDTDELNLLLKPVVAATGYILEEIKVSSYGKRKHLTVIIDGVERNPNLDEVAAISRAISEELDRISVLGDQPFTLEVTTPGIERPLTLQRHWVKNVGRMVEILLQDDKKMVGRINAVEKEKVEIDEVLVHFNDIKSARIQIEFNRKEAR